MSATRLDVRCVDTQLQSTKLSILTSPIAAPHNRSDRHTCTPLSPCVQSQPKISLDDFHIAFKFHRLITASNVSICVDKDTNVEEKQDRLS